MYIHTYIYCYYIISTSISIGIIDNIMLLLLVVVVLSLCYYHVSIIGIIVNIIIIATMHIIIIIIISIITIIIISLCFFPALVSTKQGEESERVRKDSSMLPGVLEGQALPMVIVNGWDYHYHVDGRLESRRPREPGYARARAYVRPFYFDSSTVAVSEIASGRWWCIVRPVHLPRAFLWKSPWAELSGRHPITFSGHENSHPLELRVCLSQTLRNPNS